MEAKGILLEACAGAWVAGAALRPIAGKRGSHKGSRRLLKNEQDSSSHKIRGASAEAVKFDLVGR
jgi:hypothetical protein